MARYDDSCLYTSKYAELYVKYLYPSDQNLSFSATAKSYGFSGTHNFCVRKDYLQEQINELVSINTTLFGTCKINDADSDAYICLSFEGNNLKVFGQLGGSYDANFMKFSFFADQTLIKLLLDIFREFIAI